MEEQLELKQEFYLAITYGTMAKLPVAVFSPQGGVDIEELARREPGQVVRMHFSPLRRLPSFQARELVSRAGSAARRSSSWGPSSFPPGRRLSGLRRHPGRGQPFGLASDGRLVALDCHLEVDDDALPRQPQIAALARQTGRFSGGRTVSEFERRAQEIDAMDHRGVAGRVIEFPGDLGLIIGGGGASLTAFDAVRQHGGHPANYCEIGATPRCSRWPN